MHHSIPCLYQCVRFFVDDVIYNFQVVDLPIFVLHTSVDLCVWMVAFVNVIRPCWHPNLLNCGSDIKHMMTGVKMKMVWDSLAWFDHQ